MSADHLPPLEHRVSVELIEEVLAQTYPLADLKKNQLVTFCMD
jgi:hypothetical protein